jgi:hypothetical protein
LLNFHYMSREVGSITARIARDKAAELVGANPHYVTDAKKIEQDAPELLDEVIQERLNIPQAQRVAALPVEQRTKGSE